MCLGDDCINDIVGGVMFRVPDIPSLDKVVREIVIDSVSPRHPRLVEVVFDGNIMIVGVPEIEVVSSDSPDVEVIPYIVSGGGNKVKFTLVSLGSGVDNVKLRITAYVVKGM